MAQQFQQQGIAVGSSAAPVPFITPGQLVFPSYGYQATPRSIEYKSKVARVLGTTQIIIGVVCIFFQSVIIGIDNGESMVSYIGHGIWCGAIFFVAGLLQTLSGRNPPTTCPIISTMVMSIIAACATAVLLALSAIDAYIYMDRIRYRTNYYNYYNYNQYFQRTTMSPQIYRSLEAAVALNSIMTILSIIEAIVAITASALCCKAVCCCAVQNVNPVHVLGSQQVMQIPSYPGSVSSIPPVPQIPGNPTAPPPFQQFPSSEETNNKNTSPPPYYEPLNRK